MALSMRRIRSSGRCRTFFRRPQRAAQTNPKETAINPKFIRVNERIRAREVRVIDGATQEQLGVMRTDQAIKLARSRGLDLVEIAPKAAPPVCRIVDYGKFRYDLSKQEKDRKHGGGGGRVKEIKFRVNTDEHDYITKLRRAEDFLEKGNKLKIHLQFRGREMAHQELGIEVMKRVRGDLAGMAQVDMEPRIVGRAASMTLSPLPANKRKRSTARSEREEREEDEPVDELAAKQDDA